MPEELTDSTRSEGQMNPRLKSSQRVRAVPYESCGGLCSFLNSGCFSMCCGAPKMRRRSSSVYTKKNRDSAMLQSQVKQLSEPPKKLIIPNVGDALTDSERHEFVIGEYTKPFESKEEILTKKLYISEAEIDVEETPTETFENKDDERDSAVSINDDTVSTITDTLSISGSDVEGKKKKGKKKFLGMLKIGKKRKSQDGLSSASSTASISQPETPETSENTPRNSLHNPWSNLEGSNNLFHKCSMKSKSQEFLEKVEEDLKSENAEVTSTKEDQDQIISHVKETSEVINSNDINKSNEERDALDGEQNEITSKDVKDFEEKSRNNSETVPIDESTLIKIVKTIPLAATVPRSDSDSSGESVIHVNTPTDHSKKKSFWRSSKKDKIKVAKREAESDKVENEEKLKEDDKKSKISFKKQFLGKWGSLKRAPASPSVPDSSLDLSADENTTKTPTNSAEDVSSTVNDNEELEQKIAESGNLIAEPTVKKKSFFDTLRLNKKEKTDNGGSEDNSTQHHKCAQVPCLFTSCVNSEVKPELQRKNSSDSIEVNTIASDEESEDPTKIKIIRNQFFPAEIHNRNDEPDSTAMDDALDETDTLKEDQIEQLQNSEKSFEGISIIGRNNDKEGIFLDTTEEDIPKEPVEKISILSADENIENFTQDSPAFRKKYGVIDKDDFSDSLHTLVDGDSDDHIILAPRDAICVHDLPLKHSDEEKLPGTVECSDTENTYPASCDLLVEGSKDECTNEDVKEVSPELLLESTETITGDKPDDVILDKSTDTLTDTKITSETSWVEVGNVDDLTESTFNYIYNTTLTNVKNGENHVADSSVKSQEGPFTVEESEGEAEIKINEQEENGSTKEERISNKSCEKCGHLIEEGVAEDSDAGQRSPTRCVCTTLTKPRHSVAALEEGNVQEKIAAFNKAGYPLIVPSVSVEAPKDDVAISEAHSSPTLGSKSGSKSATPSPIAAKSRSGTLSSNNSEWQNAEEDIDRMMVIQGRSSLSSLGLRSDSMASVYSGAGEGRYGTVAVKGQVEFGLQYNYKAGALEIHVKQCKDLAPVDIKRNRSDPYVKVYLLPDKSKSGKRKTKVKKHTLNPVFDETLKFQISLNGLETRTLWLTVWHSDMFGRNDFLGEVMMALENKVFDDPTPKLYNLQERTEPFDDTISFKGDIIVCLKFVPPDMTVQKKGKRSRGTLHVLVKEAKYLTAYKANGTSDPFCKSYLLPEKGRNSKQKTNVMKKTVNPVWNHTFIYDDVTLQELAERCLELTVWDHDRIASNEFLGGVRFSLGTGKHYGKHVEWMDATGKEMTLWKNMLERPNFWVEGCLSLRPTLEART